jgi:general secretion pathway protein G
MTRWPWYWKLLTLAAIAGFAYFVWPTLWAERTVSTSVGLTTTARTNRFSGRTEVLRPDGTWVDPQQENLDRAAADIETLSVALDLYWADNGEFPTTEQGLDALVLQPVSDPASGTWNGPYVTRVGPDPWGHDYVYRYPGTLNVDDYDLVSYGADGEPGGEGYAADVTNRDLW